MTIDSMVQKWKWKMKQEELMWLKPWKGRTCHLEGD